MTMHQVVVLTENESLFVDELNVTHTQIRISFSFIITFRQLSFSFTVCAILSHTTVNNV